MPPTPPRLTPPKLTGDEESDSDSPVEEDDDLKEPKGTSCVWCSSAVELLLFPFAFMISSFVSAASCSSEMSPSKQVNEHSFTI